MGDNRHSESALFFIFVNYLRKLPYMGKARDAAGFKNGIHNLIVFAFATALKPIWVFEFSGK